MRLFCHLYFVSFKFQPNPQATTHNQGHKGKGNAGGYSRALHSVQPPTKQQRDGHQPLKRAPEHPLGHWGVHLAAGGDAMESAASDGATRLSNRR